MLDNLLELSQATEIVSEDTVDGVEGNVSNYDCDL